MNLGSLLTPWIELAGVLVLLYYVEKWVQSHLYGVGWVLTNHPKTATALYYLLLSPGVFVHEFTQYIVAGALNVKIKRVMAWPEAQEDGTLRLNFVQIKQSNWVQAAVISAAPFLVGIALVWAISTRILGLDSLISALAAGDITLVGQALKNLARTPDFYLWLYLMFAISNAMLPTPADREGWPLLFAIFAVVIVFLVVIGTGKVLLETFTGPVAHGVRLLATALATVLVVETAAIVIIGFAEEIAERVTKRKFYYGQARAETSARERQPGSSDPLPAGVPMPSIYNLPLPVPSPSDIAPRRPPRPAQGLGPTPIQAAPDALRPRPAPQPLMADEPSEEEPVPGISPAQTAPPARRAADFAPAANRPYVRPDSPAAPAGAPASRLSPGPEEPEQTPAAGAVGLSGPAGSPSVANRFPRPTPPGDALSRPSALSPAQESPTGGISSRFSGYRPAPPLTTDEDDDEEKDSDDRDDKDDQDDVQLVPFDDA